MSLKSKLESLTVLRFLAAATVVIFHYGRETALYGKLPSVLAAGSIVVTFFFVLSGFVIAITNVDRPLEVGKFYLNRVGRIFPVYFLALMLYMSAFDSPMAVPEYWYSVAMVQTWVYPYSLALNAPGWSISVEMFFYFIAPGMIFLAGRRFGMHWGWWLSFAFVLWVVTQFILASLNRPPFNPGYPSLGNDIISYLPVSHLCSFVCGFAGGIAYKQGCLQNLKERDKVLLLLLSLWFCWYVSKSGFRLNAFFELRFAYGSSFYAVVFLPIIYFSALANRLVSKVIAFPLMVFLGEASYSLYILQMPVHVYYERYISNLIPMEAEQKFWLFFVILVVCSCFSYLLIEKPISTMVRRALTSGKTKEKSGATLA